jgi:hypothetical protein
VTQVVSCRRVRAADNSWIRVATHPQCQASTNATFYQEMGPASPVAPPPVGQEGPTSAGIRRRCPTLLTATPSGANTKVGYTFAGLRLPVKQPKPSPVLDLCRLTGDRRPCASAGSSGIGPRTTLAQNGSTRGASGLRWCPVAPGKGRSPLPSLCPCPDSGTTGTACARSALERTNAPSGRGGPPTGTAPAGETVSFRALHTQTRAWQRWQREMTRSGFASGLSLGTATRLPSPGADAIRSPERGGSPRAQRDRTSRGKPTCSSAGCPRPTSRSAPYSRLGSGRSRQGATPLAIPLPVPESRHGHGKNGNRMRTERSRTD